MNPSSSIPGRLRLTLLLVLPVLLLVAVTTVGIMLTTPSGDGGTRAGIARVGDGLVVVVAVDDVDAAGGPGGWLLPVLLVAVAASGLLAWQVAGRVHGVARHAEDSILTADTDRQSRLQEVVHELRTPLAVMGTNLELAAMSEGTSGDYIGAARRAVDRMSRTVDDLAGHGQLSVDQDGGPVNIGAIVDDLITEHRGPGSSRGLHLHSSGEELELVPGADPAAVRTALGNFISNAVRLAPSGSVVTVDWGSVDSWAWIAVSDEGPGIPEPLHARVFERGWQGQHDRVRNNGTGEAGLGLTIARQLTEAQGGLVSIESIEAEGTTFTLWLPFDNKARTDTVLGPDRLHPAVTPWRDRAPVSL